MKHQVPFWAKIILLALYILSILGSGFDFFGPLIAAVIGWSCANKCAGWAHKINKNNTVAFFIGGVFNLIGLLIYWLYYKSRTKK